MSFYQAGVCGQGEQLKSRPPALEKLTFKKRAGQKRKQTADTDTGLMVAKGRPGGGGKMSGDSGAHTPRNSVNEDARM